MSFIWEGYQILVIKNGFGFFKANFMFIKLAFAFASSHSKMNIYRL